MAAGAGRAKRAPRSARPRRNAAARILDAAAELVRESGAAAASLQDVADRAGVSKGLIHYHFHDRETLLARLAEWLADAVVARERAALADATPQSAIDRLWGWLDDELARGDIRALAELGREPGDAVRRAVREAAARRRSAAASTAERLFVLLGLRPRVAPPMLADVLLPFVDGLALDRTLAPERQRRVAFDIFWLALLGLAD
ncbi:MAG TPA: helix-turn-helix domain-containing protein [Gemmatimonadaceae bacterium]